MQHCKAVILQSKINDKWWTPQSSSEGHGCHKAKGPVPLRLKERYSGSRGCVDSAVPFKASWDLLRTQVRTCLGVNVISLKLGFGAIPRLPFPGGSGKCEDRWHRPLPSACSAHECLWQESPSLALLHTAEHKMKHKWIQSSGLPADNICPGIRSSVSEPGTFDHRSSKVFIPGVSSSPAVRNHSYSQTHWQLGWEWIT